MSAPRHTKSGMRATKRIPLQNRQPLKLKYSPKRNLVLLTAFGLSLGLLVTQYNQEISLFMNRPVSKVRMENSWQHIGESEIRQRLSNYMGEGFFDFDVEGVKSELESHSWVSSVSAKRVWPDTLSLQINEQVAIARWGERQLLNQYGEIFEPENVTTQANLPVLTGPENSQFEVMEQYQKLSQLLFPSALRLSGLYLSKRGSWELELNDRLGVIVGRVDVLERTQRFVDFHNVQNNEQIALIESVDLRYSNGIAVQNAEPDLTEIAAR
ncbi:MAG: FtsQ-type POTRA domain-containing protein [Gammaproteobacteria bacterium]|jgi:cell division protein FtsQ|nr:FtsQ-type POTRA domain-containing protein [Gammaproteobacteria bacterium]MBT4582978.1 FtsQ-type POTRA domain-containing protein [Gammaproteobacteria bacterium]MBT4658263.1 FtsQ-type POTRA domain-containing protein [Gammaproteobacteria bacterium]MBT6058306.1 FtsQ-type POTRA domain-containing protein [Gammaproteobacteria bacterium]MBT6875832.1 FtsQ-type POTRA domain-containing protein [Gammaproteobacteria bacterium]